MTWSFADFPNGRAEHCLEELSRARIQVGAHRSAERLVLAGADAEGNPPSTATGGVRNPKLRRDYLALKVSRVGRQLTGWIRIVYWDRNGFATWTKRLERGRFTLSFVGETKESVSPIEAAELALILEGIELAGARRVPSPKTTERPALNP